MERLKARVRPREKARRRPRRYVAFAAAGARVEGSELCGVSAALQLSGAILGSVECAHHRRHCCLCAPDNVVVGLAWRFIQLASLAVVAAPTIVLYL